MDVQLAGRRMRATPSTHTAFALTPAPDQAAAALEGSADALAARSDAGLGALHAEAAAGSRWSEGGDAWLLSEPDLACEALLALEVRCTRLASAGPASMRCSFVSLPCPALTITSTRRSYGPLGMQEPVQLLANSLNEQVSFLTVKQACRCSSKQAYDTLLVGPHQTGT